MPLKRQKRARAPTVTDDTVISPAPGGDVTHIAAAGEPSLDTPSRPSRKRQPSARARAASNAPARARRKPPAKRRARSKAPEPHVRVDSRDDGDTDGGARPDGDGGGDEDDAGDVVVTGAQLVEPVDQPALPSSIRIKIRRTVKWFKSAFFASLKIQPQTPSQYLKSHTLKIEGDDEDEVELAAGSELSIAIRPIYRTLFEDLAVITEKVNQKGAIHHTTCLIRAFVKRRSISTIRLGYFHYKAWLFPL